MTKTVLLIIIAGVLIIFKCSIATSILLSPRFREDPAGTDTSSNNDQNDEQSETGDKDNDAGVYDPIIEKAIELPLPSRSSQTCSVISQNHLPANWPDDFTLYPGAEIISVKCGSADDSDLYEVRILVSGSVDEVAGYFGTEVVSRQWTLDSLDNNDLYDTYSAYKLLDASKKHNESSRQMILDIRKRIDDLQGGRVEVIYRERGW